MSTISDVAKRAGVSAMTVSRVVNGFASVARTDPEAPPLDLRREIAARQVKLSDGTHLYVDAASGGIVATRTRWWRFYDFMWGLHIMDLQTREDSSHPVLIGFAGLSLISLLMAFWLLIARQRRKSAIR